VCAGTDELKRAKTNIIGYNTGSAMDNLFTKLEIKIRKIFPEALHELIWNKLWETTAVFLENNLDQKEIDELIVKLDINHSQAENLEILIQAADKVEMGRMRLFERLNYVLDNFK
jgi:hypothetical protein